MCPVLDGAAPAADRRAVDASRTTRSGPAALLALLATLVVGATYFWWVAQQEPRWVTEAPTGHHLPLYGKSLLEGHLYVKQAPPEMTRLPNPYDPEQYRSYFYVDLSYYRGYFYSYYGVVPALTLFAPWTALTGTYLTENFAAALYLSLAYAVALRLLLAMRRRYLSDAPAWAIALGATVLAFGNLGLFLLMTPPHPRVIQACAWFWLVVALAASFAAVQPGRHGVRWLAVASLACGLMIASRPSHLGAAALLLPPAWLLRCGQPAHGVAPVPWSRLCAALLPLVAIGAAIAWFNQARFDSPFEFGTRYWQDGADRPGVRVFSLAPIPENVRGHLLRVPALEAEFPFLPFGDESLGALVMLPFVWLALLLPIGWRVQERGDRSSFGALVLGAALVPWPILLAISLIPVHYVRHEMDFVLPLAWLGAVGLLSGAHAWRSRPIARRALVIVAAMLALVSVLTTVCVAMADWNHPEIPWLGPLLDAPVRAWNSLARSGGGPS